MKNKINIFICFAISAILIVVYVNYNNINNEEVEINNADVIIDQNKEEDIIIWNEEIIKEPEQLAQREIIESHFLSKCEIFTNWIKLLEIFENEFKEEFTWEWKTQWEIELYNTVLSYLQNWKTYIEFENELFKILWEADGDNVEILQLNINFFYSFFYTQNYQEEFSCSEVVEKYLK